MVVSGLKRKVYNCPVKLSGMRAKRFGANGGIGRGIQLQLIGIQVYETARSVTDQGIPMHRILKAKAELNDSISESSSSFEEVSDLARSRHCCCFSTAKPIIGLVLEPL